MTAITMPAFLRGLFRIRPERPTRRFIVSCEASGMTWAVHADSYPALYQAIGRAVYGVTSTPVLLALARGGWDHGEGAYGPCLSIAEIE